MSVLRMMAATCSTFSRRGVKLAVLVAAAHWLLAAAPAGAVVVLSDGFGDADRNNDGVIALYDTDINNNGTINDPTADAGLASRGIVEVTAATNPADTGIVWSGTRSFDSMANIAKSNLKIINDNVATGTEVSPIQIHNDGLALGVEGRGGGSQFIGKFGQSVAVGPVAGDKVTVSFDFRFWREAATATTTINSIYEFRYGLYQDTDGELGDTAPYGDGFNSAPPGATVEWGKDDGNWFASQPGAEGDKGLFTNLQFGSGAVAGAARINWEHNVANINGTTNPGQLLVGLGVSNTFGAGGDVGTVASPTVTVPDGPGGIIHGDLGNSAPHKLSMEIVRLADGLIQVATFVDDFEILRDEIKTTDTGFSVIGPPASSYDYIAFRANEDFDYVIDNFLLERFGSNAGVNNADFDGDSDVDGADFLTWQRGLGTAGGLSQGNANGDGIIDGADLAIWRSQFGQTAVPAANAIPEPSGLLLTLFGLIGLAARRRRY